MCQRGYAYGVVVHTDERAWGAASTGAAAANVGFERIEMHAIGFKEAHLFEPWIGHTSRLSPHARLLLLCSCVVQQQRGPSCTMI